MVWDYLLSTRLTDRPTKPDWRNCGMSQHQVKHNLKTPVENRTSLEAPNTAT